MRRLALALLLAASPAAAQDGGQGGGQAGAPGGAGPIAVHDAYAVAPPVPGASTGAAYMVIVNAGPADRLLSAVSPLGAVMLHETVETGGVVGMAEADAGLAIPGGGEVALARGGAHLMLMGLAAPLADGDVVPLTLVFEKAGAVAVEVPVDQSRFAAPGGHGTMDHGTMDHGAMGHGATDHDAAD